MTKQIETKKKRIRMIVESGGFSAHPVWGLLLGMPSDEKYILIPYAEYLELTRNQIRPKGDIYKM